MSAQPEHPSVKIWRDTFKMNTSVGYKSDIELTVGPDGEAGLRLWKSILDGWWYVKNGKKIRRNPLDIKGQLSAYEETARYE